MSKNFGIFGKIGIFGKMWNIGKNLEYCCKSTIFQTNPQYSKKNLNIPQYSNYSKLGSLIGILHLDIIGGVFPCLQREPATPGQVPGVSRETPDHRTTYAVRYLPKCLYYQANPQRARLAMTEKMTSLGLAFGLTNFVNFYHFLSAPMRFIMEGCHEQ